MVVTISGYPTGDVTVGEWVEKCWRYNPDYHCNIFGGHPKYVECGSGACACLNGVFELEQGPILDSYFHPSARNPCLYRSGLSYCACGEGDGWFGCKPGQVSLDGSSFGGGWCPAGPIFLEASVVGDTCQVGIYFALKVPLEGGPTNQCDDEWEYCPDYCHSGAIWCGCQDELCEDARTFGEASAIADSDGCGVWWNSNITHTHAASYAGCTLHAADECAGSYEGSTVHRFGNPGGPDVGTDYTITYTATVPLIPREED